MSDGEHAVSSVAAREGVERYDDAPEPETGTQRPETPWPPPKPGQHESALLGLATYGPLLRGEQRRTGRGGLNEFFAAHRWSRENAGP